MSTPHPAAKSGELDSSDLDVFKKQAACLNFSPDFHFGDSTGKRPQTLCRDYDTHSSNQYG